MKLNIKIKYLWNFFKAVVIIGVILAFFMPGTTAFQDINKMSITRDIDYVETSSIFTIENPPVDFEVVDADPFDGFGDNGPYSTFNDALLGTIGECRSMAEFDISEFSVLPGEVISMATFEVIITEIDVFGLGVDGETPESLVVDGYVGNGLEELSDFEAGDDHVLDSIDIPDPEIGQVLSFNVTSFVIDLINAQEQYVGLTIRAETFGGLWVTEGGVFPKLTIETILEAEPDLDCDGSLSWTDVSPGSTVEGSFQVSNVGDNGSELNWEISEWPDWGEWIFTPLHGMNLTAEGNPITVDVEVVAPVDPNTEFPGEVKIVNSDDPSDYCIILVDLKTPKSNCVFSSFFIRFLE